MYAQALVDFLLLCFGVWLIWTAFKKLVNYNDGSSASTLRLKVMELKAQRQRLEELEKEVETTKTLAEIRKKMEQCDDQIRNYESQIKRKEKGKSDGNG